MKVIGYLLLMTGGIVMSAIGHSAFHWEYWAVMTPTITGAILIQRE